MATAIGDFLQARRARIGAGEYGLPDLGTRRVPGLRREEVALLAGVSPDYYIRLEQGRARAVSDEVLHAVARVLKLDPVETDHLRRLARPAGRPARRSERAGTPARPGVLTLLAAMTDVPAFVLGPAMDVLATNLLGEAVLALPEDPAWRNTARHALLDPAARDYYPEWERVVRETVAHLRRSSGLRPDDARLRTVIGELTIGSRDFVRHWARQEVAAKTHGTKLIDHPDAGRLAVHYETLELPGDPDQLLVTYTPADPVTRDALVALGALAAGDVTSDAG